MAQLEAPREEVDHGALAVHQVAHGALAAHQVAHGAQVEVMVAKRKLQPRQQLQVLKKEKEDMFQLAHQEVITTNKVSGYRQSQKIAALEKALVAIIMNKVNGLKLEKEVGAQVVAVKQGLLRRKRQNGAQVEAVALQVKDAAHGAQVAIQADHQEVDPQEKVAPGVQEDHQAEDLQETGDQAAQLEAHGAQVAAQEEVLLVQVQAAQEVDTTTKKASGLM